jgi:putative hydrolase of the HAD superfamily
MPVILQAETVLHTWLERHAPRLAAEYDIEALRKHRKSVTQERPDIAHNLTLTRMISLQQLLRQYEYDIRLADRAVERFRVERNKVTPYDDVKQVLEVLGKHYFLIAVTNGNADINYTPLKGYFQHALTAEMVGASKPDPAIFIEAMQLGQAKPEQTLHIGDNPDTDIKAAHDVGIHSIWVNRQQQTWPEDLKPALLEINHLDQLLSLLL